MAGDGDDSLEFGGKLSASVQLNGQAAGLWPGFFVSAMIEHSSSAWTFTGLEITDPGPEPLPSDPILLDGRVIGYLTSISMGCRTGKLLALGYVENRALAPGARCDVQAFGDMRAVIRHDHHVYDPDNSRLRASPNPPFSADHRASA